NWATGGSTFGDLGHQRALGTDPDLQMRKENTMPHRNKKGGNGERMGERTGEQTQSGVMESRDKGEGTESSRLPIEKGRHPLTRLRDEIGSLFDRFFGSWSMPWEWGLGSDRFWGLDVQDEEKEIVVRAEAPGFDPKDFNIQISGNTLAV